MKNTFKKAICTALAAVSLSALITFPPPPSNPLPRTGKGIVNVLEADAGTAPETREFALYEFGNFYGKGNYDEKLVLTYKITKNNLCGRKTENGKKVVKFREGLYVKIDKIIIADNEDGECRIWGRTYDDYVCNDGKKRQVWICLKKAIHKTAGGTYKDNVSYAQCQGIYGTYADHYLCDCIRRSQHWHNCNWIQFSRDSRRVVTVEFRSDNPRIRI